jgi:thioredoxin 1
MSITPEYSVNELARADIDELRGTALLEVETLGAGTASGRNRSSSALQDHPDIRHIRIADASARRLGRSFGVKLWPTLIFLKDGRQIARLVRPVDAGDVHRAVEAIVVAPFERRAWSWHSRKEPGP